MAKLALGRGLSALIPETVTAREREVVEIDVARVKAGRFQPRLEFDAERLRELVESIKEKGVIQPIIVRPAGGEFELIAGERRLRAAKALGARTLPAIVKNADDRQALELAIVENVQREDLNPIEEARAYRTLGEAFTLTQEEIAGKVGKSRAAVANAIRLLKLPEEVQDDIAAGRLTAGHAKVLLAAADPRQQKALRDLIVARGLSVREAERWIARMQRKPRHRAGAAPRKSAELLKIEENLRGAYGTQVRIVPGRRKGRIEVEYYSQEDLERILEMMLPGFAE
ncbi:MAG TPA: ParB/RepB/Spo0J family partition protein [bacterium]|nr:ParB/RepB/Spo0J family partition protein [bacterium]